MGIVGYILVWSVWYRDEYGTVPGRPILVTDFSCKYTSAKNAVNTQINTRKRLTLAIHSIHHNHNHVVSSSTQHCSLICLEMYKELRNGGNAKTTHQLTSNNDILRERGVLDFYTGDGLLTPDIQQNELVKFGKVFPVNAGNSVALKTQNGEG